MRRLEPDLYDDEDWWPLRLVCGPREWPKFWRRAWLVTLPASLLIWPAVWLPAFVIAFGGVCAVRIVAWFVSIWNGEDYEAVARRWGADG